MCRHDDLPALHAAGVRAFISLVDDPMDAPIYLSAGFDFLHLPVAVGGAPTVEQAEAAAVSYRGGTIYPLIYLSEIERLTVDRTARLQADLDELRRLGN